MLPELQPQRQQQLETQLEAARGRIPLLLPTSTPGLPVKQGIDRTLNVTLARQGSLGPQELGLARGSKGSRAQHPLCL